VKLLQKKRKFFIITLAFTLVFLSILMFYEPSDYLSKADYNKALAPRVLYWGSQGQDVKNVQWQLVK